MKYAHIFLIPLLMWPLIIIADPNTAIPNDSTKIDTPARFPGNTSGTYPAVPMKYCCATWLDYANTIVMANKGASWMRANQSMPGDDDTLSKSFSTFTGGMSPVPNFPNLTSTTARRGNEDNNYDGQWINCPAGFMMTGSQFAQKGGGDDSDSIFCVPVKQTCGWVIPGQSPIPSTIIHYFPLRPTSGEKDKPATNQGYSSYNFDYNTSSYTTCQ